MIKTITLLNVNRSELRDHAHVPHITLHNIATLTDPFPNRTKIEQDDLLNSGEID